jgi:hypothetical protein
MSALIDFTKVIYGETNPIVLDMIIEPDLELAIR